MRPFLCVRTGGLGDLLLLRRAVSTLHRGGYDVWLLAPERHASALLGPGGVERVIDWEGPDVAALLHDDPSPDIPLAERLRQCAAAIVYSTNVPLIRAIARIVPDTVSHPPRPDGELHAAVWCTQPALAFAPDVAEPPPCSATPGERQRAGEILRALPVGFLAIHPGSGSPAKNWPMPRFAAIVEELAQGAAWLLVEGPAEAGRLGALRQLPGVRIASGLPPRVLGAALSAAGTYVGNDSGVTHLAASWGAPTVALFGPTNPTHWAPVGQRVRVLAAPSGDLSALTVDEVLRAVRHFQRGDATPAPTP
jgi:hypothetical protein